MRIKLFGLIGTNHLADGAVTNAKVNAAAAIASTKLDLSAIAQVLTPDGDNTRDQGTGALRFRTGYFGTSVEIAGNDVMAYIAANALLGD